MNSEWFGHAFEEAMGIHRHDDEAAAAAIRKLGGKITRPGVAKWRAGGGMHKRNEEPVAHYMGITVGHLQRMLREQYPPGSRDADVYAALERLEAQYKALTKLHAETSAKVRELRRDMDAVQAALRNARRHRKDEN